MATKVFISWSGDLSKKLAEAVREWLPGVLQFVTPYFTPSDIDKGNLWLSDITRELKTSGVGIICLTKDNLKNPWILFEAGALSNRFDEAKVCTLLFGLNSADIGGPLTMFQNTSFNKEDFKSLIKTINESAGEQKLGDSTLEIVFEKWWPELEATVTEILDGSAPTTDEPVREDRELLEEILKHVRTSNRVPILGNQGETSRDLADDPYRISENFPIEYRKLQEMGYTRFELRQAFEKLIEKEGPHKKLIDELILGKNVNELEKVLRLF